MRWVQEQEEQAAAAVAAGAAEERGVLEGYARMACTTCRMCERRQPYSCGAPAELLLVPARLLQLPPRQTLWVHLARALAGADHLVTAILRRLLQADPAHVAL